MRIRASMFLIILLLLPACARTTARLERLELGMTQEEVREAMGKPNAVRGNVPLKNGETLEVWEYILAYYATEMYGVGHPYVLYFYQDRLAQWGEPGDFTPEQIEIYLHQMEE